MNQSHEMIEKLTHYFLTKQVNEYVTVYLKIMSVNIM